MCASQKSTTAATLINNQKKATKVIAHHDFFRFLNLPGVLPEDFVQQQCYAHFLGKAIPIPNHGSMEVPRDAVGTVHQYFDAMFRSILAVLCTTPAFANAASKIKLCYEETLTPSRFIPDFHLRRESELVANTLAAFLLIRVKRESRPSSLGNSMIEGWSDSIALGNEFIQAFILDKGKDAALEELLGASIVSLALTPKEVTASRIFISKDPEMSTSWVKQQESVCDPPLPLHGPNNTHGEGFAMLVKAFALGPDALCVERAPLPWFEVQGGERVTLTHRVGRGGSSDTYRAADGSAVKVGHSNVVNLQSEGAILDILNYRAARTPAAAGSVPFLLDFDNRYIRMNPCGVPLMTVVGSLFAHQKLVAMQLQPDRPKSAAAPQRPVGLLSLGYFVLLHLSRAHRRATSVCAC